MECYVEDGEEVNCLRVGVGESEDLKSMEIASAGAYVEGGDSDSDIVGAYLEGEDLVNEDGDGGGEKEGNDENQSNIGAYIEGEDLLDEDGGGYKEENDDNNMGMNSDGFSSKWGLVNSSLKRKKGNEYLISYGVHEEEEDENVKKSVTSSQV
jgi:hypothetical protein